MNLYNKNTEILKSFFKKPLTLIISILYFASALITCIYIIKQSITPNDFDFIPFCVYPLFMILPAFAFLYLFIQGRKCTEISRLNAPLILIYIYTSLSVFVPIVFFTYIMLTSASEVNEFNFVFLSIFLFIIIVPALILLTLQFISMIIVFHSIRKSANRIYLSKKGSVFMGVTSILTASAITIGAVDLINTTGYSRVLGYVSIFDSVILILGAVIAIALFVCLGIWSLMYSATIRNASVCLYGAKKKSPTKVQSLTNSQDTLQNNNVNIKEQNTNVYVSEKQPDIFAMPKQNEPNPYNKNGYVQSRNDKIESSESNHINFSNPYKNFVPQNPFIDNDNHSDT